MVACCGVLAGQMRSDTNLLNTAQEAYHRTVHQLRKQLGGVEDSENSLLKQNAMILVTATWAVMVEKVSLAPVLPYSKVVADMPDLQMHLRSRH